MRRCLEQPCPFALLSSIHRQDCQSLHNRQTTQVDSTTTHQHDLLLESVMDANGNVKRARQHTQMYTQINPTVRFSHRLVQVGRPVYAVICTVHVLSRAWQIKLWDDANPTHPPIFHYCFLIFHSVHGSLHASTACTAVRCFWPCRTRRHQY